MTVFFIGDTHFGHKNIIKFEAGFRPFNSIEAHDEELILRWHNVVRDNDIVWHLGDVAICGSDRIARILPRLRGQKRLVLGNHDKAKHFVNHFKLFGVGIFEHHILTHVPVHPNNVSHENHKGRFSKNIHGHLHHNVMMCDGKPDERYWNVSCEQINLTPIAYEDLKKLHEQAN